MSDIAPAERAGTHSRWRAWRSELVATLRLALPMALTQLGQIAMMTTDLALLGRLGPDVVAAAALAHTILFAAFTLGMGVMSAVAPLAAQSYGARDPRMVRRALRVGLWAAVLVGAPLMYVQFWGETVLIALGQKAEAAHLAGRYLDGLAWSLIPAFAFMALRNFMGAINRPEPALWITMAAVPLNGVLAYGMIYGAFGLPRLDLLGAGLATTFVNIGMCLAAIWIAYARRPYKKYQILGRFWRPDWQLFRQLLVLGLPISGSFLLEYGLFASAALMMGRISTIALAAHQIALQTAAIMFMVPFGISLAATVRVGQAVGRGDADGARQAGFVAIGLAVTFMAGCTMLVAATRYSIPLFFLGGHAGDVETVELAAALLLLGASFFIADGIQTVAAGALRGLNDTRIPLVMAVIGFWVVGFVSAYALAFAAGYGAVGVWIGLSLGLAVFAAMLVGRFAMLTRRRQVPPVAGS